jgi:hypothetical protein
MRRNIIETVMGGVVLLVAAGFVVLAFESGTVRSPTGYQVTAEFDNASGLGPGSEVRMSGVKIGTVTSQSLDPDTFFAVVVLNISESIKLPRDNSARDHLHARLDQRGRSARPLHLQCRRGGGRKVRTVTAEPTAPDTSSGRGDPAESSRRDGPGPVSSRQAVAPDARCP